MIIKVQFCLDWLWIPWLDRLRTTFPFVLAIGEGFATPTDAI